MHIEFRDGNLFVSLDGQENQDLLTQFEALEKEGLQDSPLPQLYGKNPFDYARLVRTIRLRKINLPKRRSIFNQGLAILALLSGVMLILGLIVFVSVSMSVCSFACLALFSTVFFWRLSRTLRKKQELYIDETAALQLLGDFVKWFYGISMLLEQMPATVAHISDLAKLQELGNGAVERDIKKAWQLECEVRKLKPTAAMQVLRHHSGLAYDAVLMAELKDAYFRKYTLVTRSLASQWQSARDSKA